MSALSKQWFAALERKNEAQIVAKKIKRQQTTMVRPASNENSMTLQIVQSCRIVWARVCLIEIDYRTCFVMTVKFYGNKI